MLHPNRPISGGDIVSYEAEAAVTKYRAVIQGTSDDQVDMPSAANDQAVGIAYTAAALGARCDVVIKGTCPGTASAAIARGSLVAIAGTSGKLVAITPGTTTADLRVVGKALTAAAADGDLFTVDLFNNDYVQV